MLEPGRCTLEFRASVAENVKDPLQEKNLQYEYRPTAQKNLPYTRLLSLSLYILHIMEITCLEFNFVDGAGKIYYNLISHIWKNYKLSVRIGGVMMFTYRTESPDGTVELGEWLGTLLQPGMVLLLEGDLGAGKTCLAGGIMRGLGVDEHVTSPTYTLVNEYMGRFPVAHFDLYRLDDPEALFDIGFEEYLDGKRVVLIEWPERAGGYLPAQYLHVMIQGGGTERQIMIESEGAVYADLDEEMRNFVGTGN